MKNKKIKDNTKALIALLMIISFASVATWYNVKNAHGYVSNYIGSSKHYEDGYAVIMIEGPSGSSKLNIKFISNDYNKEWYSTGSGKNKKTYYYRDQKGIDFIKNSHSYTVKWDAEGGGDYNLWIDEQTITSLANTDNLYTGLAFKVKYKLPAHEQHRSWDWVTLDVLKDSWAHAGGDGGFWDNSYHHSDADGQWKEVTCHLAVGNVGLNTSDGYRNTWPSITMHLARTSGTLSFDGNGGSLSSYSRSLTDRDPYGELPDGTRTGYELAGYNTNQWGTGDWVTEDWLFCGDYKIYAIWKANTYNISYDCGDGEGKMSDTSATYDQTVSLSKCTFKKKGYKFMGWSKTENGPVDYADNASFTYKTADDITLYAVWEKDNFEVAFHGNGSSGNDYTAELSYNKTVNLPHNIFERPGYTFIGWAEKDESEKEVPEEVKYTDGQAVKDLCEPGDTCHLYALWKKTDGSFETQNIIHDENMFLGDINIVGGNGTEYSQSNIDSKAAKIDTTDDPGYFTKRYE